MLRVDGTVVTWASGGGEIGVGVTDGAGAGVVATGAGGASRTTGGAVVVVVGAGTGADCVS